jgi:Flp pilus assembly pilin Flp
MKLLEQPAGTAAARTTAKRRQRGQGMMEYVIIVALIAVASIAVYSAWGKTLRNQSAGMAKELSGNKADNKLAEDAANAAAGRANDPQKAGMAGYNYGNDGK